MGACDCHSAKSKKAESNRDTYVSERTSTQTNRQTMKYFPTNTKTTKKDILVLNNDVIVSDTGKNPEKIYQKIKLLGEGAFGEVWLVRHKVLGKDFAMKIIKKSPHCITKEIINEINILKKLDHPNILKILEFHLTETKFYIITDYCPEGELFTEISNNKIFSEAKTAFVIYQILNAIRYCHKMRVLHRDIKPENIMIMGRENNGYLNVKLIDFGTAKIFSEGNMQKGLVGSSYYVAPEVIKGKYDEACDIWSIGVIMYLMLTGYPPFNGDNDDEILNAVTIGEYDTSLEEYQNLSNNAKDLISKLLKYDPKERITARDAINHPWFKTSEFKDNYKRNNSMPIIETTEMFKNLENYRSDNMLKCAALAYLVHQNSNIKQCTDASKLFFDIDLNHDGKLEANELEQGYIKYLGLSPDEAKKKRKLIFKNIDNDNNGYIESEEFIRACINPRLFNSKNYLKFAFDYFDNDKSGFISINEIEKKFLLSSKNKSDITKRELKKLFDKIDVNHDGEISFEEFSDMIRNIINT